MRKFRYVLFGFTAGLLIGVSPLALQPLGVPKPTMRHVEHYTPAFTLCTLDDVPAKRQLLIDRVFGGELPTVLPTQEGDLLLMTLADGFTSTAHYTPGPRNTLVIYHAGHAGDYPPDAAAVEALVSAGYPVVYMDMPLYGRNRRADMVTHNQFALRTLSVPALRIFLEPPVQVVNWAEQQGYTRIAMIGLSGGGWTTTLSAAIDPRIALSVPVAGSTPLGAILQDVMPDYEQQLPGLFPDVTYEDLYVMGAHGRTQVQVINQFDTCCHNYDSYPVYETAVQQMLGDAGQFAVHLDAGETAHRVSPDALAVIQGALG